ncbi:hypothetical protein TrCOL_g4763 [Triparma columacea]|uniref:Uncharacterized protein n=1 Tax=Triparma columacea TaxID=722753 RepID=A0A9W7GLG0_9STRA|nr:hypothetical protein TrCOL_g4763 [Triparma columacea]
MKSFTSIKAKKRKVPVVLKRDGSYELLAGEGGEEPAPNSSAELYNTFESVLPRLGYWSYDSGSIYLGAKTDSGGVVAEGVVSTFGGKVVVGRSMVKKGAMIYPEMHDKFMDAPQMFNPRVEGGVSWEMTRVMKETNLERELVEVRRFGKEDIEGRTFTLVTESLVRGEKPRKLGKGWGKKGGGSAGHQGGGAVVGLNMFKVVFKLDNTFSLYRVGSEAEVKGKWRITGEKSDQLWATVSAFGFGEGIEGGQFNKGLSGNDERSYWGTVVREEEGGEVRCDGVVLYGIGLEPVAMERFWMKCEEEGKQEEEE